MDDNLAIALVSVKPENRCEKNNDKACPCIIFIYIYIYIWKNESAHGLQVTWPTALLTTDLKLPGTSSYRPYKVNWTKDLHRGRHLKTYNNLILINTHTRTRSPHITTILQLSWSAAERNARRNVETAAIYRYFVTILYYKLCIMYNNNIILTLGTFSNEFTIYLFVICTSVITSFTHYTIASQYHESIFTVLAIKGWVYIKKYTSEYILIFMYIAPKYFIVSTTKNNVSFCLY